MRHVAAILVTGLLAACAPSVPTTPTTGVGFGTFEDFESRNSQQALTGPFVPAGQLAPDARSNLETRPIGQPPAITQVNPQPQPQAQQSSSPMGLSDEQSFEAVAARESIESDRQRIEQQREEFVVIQPGALPSRPSNSEPSVVEFALATRHPVGQKVYARSALSGTNRFHRNCAKYASSDLAQAAFLKAGGPERDRMGLDPDGDGYACFWDPTPFRAAVGR